MTWLAIVLVMSSLGAHYEVRYELAPPDQQGRVGCKINQQSGKDVRPDWVVKGFVKNVPFVQDFEHNVARTDTLDKAMKECRAWIKKEEKDITKTQGGLK